MDLSQLKSGEEPYHQLERFGLRMYYASEIENLSVIEVKQTQTFDELGIPTRDGLYDRRMGVSDPLDKCDTCQLHQIYCPGHFGFIRLDVPVFNPLLFKLIFELMKGSCLHCHRLMCDSKGFDAMVFIRQLQICDLGAHDRALNLREAVSDINEAIEERKEAMSSNDQERILAEFDRLIKHIKENGAAQSRDFVFPTKNAVEVKKGIVKEFLKTHLFRRKTKCPLCGGHNGTLRNDNARCLLIDFSTAKIDTKSRSKKVYRRVFGDEEEEIDEMNEEDDTPKSGYTTEEETGGILRDATSEKALNEQMNAVKSGACTKLAWRGAEVREHFRLLWKNDGDLLRKVFPILDHDDGGICPLDGLFCEFVLVPPVKFRPIRLFKGERFESPQTVNLRKLLEASEVIKAISLVMKGRTDAALMDLIAMRAEGKTLVARMHSAYLHLQLRMNAIFDEDLNKADPAHIPGMKQIMEKKQGLFRMNMMGKRVNYACRSVITPDPYLDIDEIGIPEVFAKKLTFIEPINIFNEQHMRNLVRTGADVYPGANAVIKSNMVKQHFPAGKEKERHALASRLAPATVQHVRQPEKIYRHLVKGDMMMMNRQPSLHKPSIMGHRARILKGQRALRMNYAPCKAYNADFDGDEMNGHLVQTHIAQTEVSELASVGNNFLVPKDATPLLGLIQDHVVSGVLLTLRGRFLTKEDFMHLVLSAFAETSDRLVIPPPAMIKPQRLWSGKQVISTIIRNCTPSGKPLINLTGKAKTPLSCWQVAGHRPPPFNMSESEVVFRQGELLVGVLDKAHYGATQYGLGHCMFELYGPRIGVKVLSCFSRLFTTYLQLHGFTLGVADILVRKDADKKRKKAIQESRTIGDEVVRNAFNLDESASPEQLHHVLASTYCNPKGIGQDVKMLDYSMKQSLSKHNDAIVKACVPDGLIRSFPENGLQMMIQSGAKGSSVNAMQISCNLGQIELEGKRMAVTIAGRTLPSFKAFDSSPRAGGYIDQRFLTGINPQELFFHTMAGREGLIDTAVKTSRSGYLQRCIIKHLEGIRVHYDNTCRDHDGSVIQFRYGEDGMDVCKSTFMSPKQYPFITDNLEAALLSSKPTGARDRDYAVDSAEKQYAKIKKYVGKKTCDTDKKYRSGFIDFCNENPGATKSSLVKKWRKMSDDERLTYDKKALRDPPRPVDMKLNPCRTLGALPEKMLDEIDKFTSDKDARIRRTLFWKGMRSMAEPGENVGLLAAQSIGEPSTQMTLNTFHFAGRGEMNVTLGIPRLREILMTASKNIATPSAQIAVVAGTPRARVDAIKRQLDRIYLRQVISRFILDECVHRTSRGGVRRYLLTIKLLAANKRELNARHITHYDILREIENRFIKGFTVTIARKSMEAKKYQQIQHKKLRAGNLDAGAVKGDEGGMVARQKTTRRDEGMSSDEEADNGQEADAGEARLAQRHNDEAAEYEGEDEDMEEVEIEKGQAVKEDEMSDGDDEDEEDANEGDNEMDDDGETTKIRRKSTHTRISHEERANLVISSSRNVSKYEIDAKDRWCRVTVEFNLKDTKLDLLSILEYEIDNFIVSQTPGIERCIEREEEKDGKTVLLLQTQGVNLQAFYQHSDVLNVNSIYTNDLNLILKTYGVEACSRAIVTEMNNVFAVYGIEVSRRHLSLTADYMTFTGAIAPFNRGAMAVSSSPLQKMTFETTIAFLRDSLISGDVDTLASPSARLVVGALTRGGTGAFDVFLSAPKMAEYQKDLQMPVFQDTLAAY